MLDEMQRIFGISNDIMINVKIVSLLACDLEKEEVKSIQDLKKIAPNILNISDIKNQLEEAFNKKSHYVERVKKSEPSSKSGCF